MVAPHGHTSKSHHENVLLLQPLHFKLITSLSKWQKLPHPVVHTSSAAIFSTEVIYCLEKISANSDSNILFWNKIDYEHTELNIKKIIIIIIKTQCFIVTFPV